MSIMHMELKLVHLLLLLIRQNYVLFNEDQS